MQLKRKIFSYALLGGFALAANVEFRQRFDVLHPAVFYGVHGTFIAAVGVGLLVFWLTGKLSGVRALRLATVVGLLYAVALNRSAVASWAIVAAVLVPIVFWVVRVRGGAGLGSAS